MMKHKTDIPFPYPSTPKRAFLLTDDITFTPNRRHINIKTPITNNNLIHVISPIKEEEEEKEEEHHHNNNNINYNNYNTRSNSTPKSKPPPYHQTTIYDNNNNNKKTNVVPNFTGTHNLVFVLPCFKGNEINLSKFEADLKTNYGKSRNTVVMLPTNQNLSQMNTKISLELDTTKKWDSVIFIVMGYLVKPALFLHDHSHKTAVTMKDVIGIILSLCNNISTQQIKIQFFLVAYNKKSKSKKPKVVEWPKPTSKRSTEGVIKKTQVFIEKFETIQDLQTTLHNDLFISTFISFLVGDAKHWDKNVIQYWKRKIRNIRKSILN